MGAERFISWWTVDLKLRHGCGFRVLFTAPASEKKQRRRIV